jgi:hypothetical protein
MGRGLWARDTDPWPWEVVDAILCFCFCFPGPSMRERTVDAVDDSMSAAYDSHVS